MFDGVYLFGVDYFVLDGVCGCFVDCVGFVVCLCVDYVDFCVDWVDIFCVGC